MRSSVLILLALLAFLLVPFPQAAYATSAPLATVSGTLNVGESRDFTYSVSQELDDALLHVTVTASAPQTDRLDLTLEGAEGAAVWSDLQGDWWDAWGRYIDILGPLTAGDHTLTAAAGPDAVNPITFTVEFYDIPAPPFTVQGSFPANPFAGSDVAYIHINLPEAGNYPLSAVATAGNFELSFPDTANEPVSVQGSTKLTMQFAEAAVYEFQVQADILGTGQATAWSITIQQRTTTPSLNVKITEGCIGTAPSTSCLFGANATATDGSQPDVRYNWTATGGCFVDQTGACVSSILGQIVNWTAPGTNETTYTLTVNASADGYDSGTASWPIAVPEFPSTVPALAISLICASAIILVKRRRKR